MGNMEMLFSGSVLASFLTDSKDKSLIFFFCPKCLLSCKQFKFYRNYDMQQIREDGHLDDPFKVW